VKLKFKVEVDLARNPNASAETRELVDNIKVKQESAKMTTIPKYSIENINVISVTIGQWL